MKCIICKQRFLKGVKKLGVAGRSAKSQTCPGCKKLAPRASKRSFKEKRK